MFLDSGMKKECCGCTSCKHICPVDAIEMKSDNEGFLYPHIIESKCIHCNLCRKVCPFSVKRSSNQQTDKYPKVFAFKNKDKNVRVDSASGGASSAISQYILSKDGVIYGAAFDSEYRVKHIRAMDSNDAQKIRKSKYVQSDLDDVFLLVKKDLSENRYVLFTGTPCQTSGLYNYLSKSKVNTDNLILCDIVCHGVPSPLIWMNYIKSFSKKNGNIKEINFRAKSNDSGWCPFILKINSDKREYSEVSSKNAYYRLFFDHFIIRPSCHDCKFTNLCRPSDITTADFWGIENSEPSFHDEVGVSLVLLNSEKGEKLFNSIKDRHMYLESSRDNCLQPNLIRPTAENPLRSKFWEDYERKGFQYALKKYGELPFKSKVKEQCKDVLKTLHLFDFAKKIVKGNDTK